MMRVQTLVAGFLLCGSAAAFALPESYPHKITVEEARSGAALQHPDAKSAEFRGVATVTRELLKSPDGKMAVGLYRMSDGEFDSTTNGYGLNELVVLVSGKLRLEGADGKVMELLPGEALTIMKGWKGKWKSVGESTYYYAVNTSSGPTE